jgi:hypothetical protein
MRNDGRMQIFWVLGRAMQYSELEGGQTTVIVFRLFGLSGT